MILRELFERSTAHRANLVWSKRGPDIEKRVETKPSTAVKGRKQIMTKKDHNG